MSKLKDLQGMIFGDKKVIRKVPNNSGTNARWLCKCVLCGRITTPTSYQLLNHPTNRCMCNQGQRKFNTFDFTNVNYVTCFDESGNSFIVDHADVPRLEGRYWGVSRGRGYVKSSVSGSPDILLHRFLLNCPDDKIVDHINHDTSDNRSSVNLRVCTQQENNRNLSKYRTNSTGKAGVYKYGKGRFRVKLSVGGKETHIGVYDSFEEAVYARISAEKSVYGDFANKEGWVL